MLYASTLFLSVPRQMPENLENDHHLSDTLKNMTTLPKTTIIKLWYYVCSAELNVHMTTVYL